VSRKSKQQRDREGASEQSPVVATEMAAPEETRQRPPVGEVTVVSVQLPSVGRTVHYRGLPVEACNGQDWHPAIITNVFFKDPLACLNLKVLFDNGPIENRTSIEHESKGTPRAWRWPPRV